VYRVRFSVTVSLQQGYCSADTLFLRGVPVDVVKCSDAVHPEPTCRVFLSRMQFLATYPEVPGSIPGHTRFSEK
jgi:hypothetical protein